MEGRACENGTQSPDKTAKVCKKKKQGKKKRVYVAVIFYIFHSFTIFT